jgi:hypothetical protein
LGELEQGREKRWCVIRLVLIKKLYHWKRRKDDKRNEEEWGRWKKFREILKKIFKKRRKEILTIFLIGSTFYDEMLLWK